jgi:hypothetical protein
MKEALVIFIILLLLLTVISVFGGSIRFTPDMPARAGGAYGGPTPAYGPPPLFGGSYAAPFEKFSEPTLPPLPAAAPATVVAPPKPVVPTPDVAPTPFDGGAGTTTAGPVEGFSNSNNRSAGSYAPF